VTGGGGEVTPGECGGVMVTRGEDGVVTGAVFEGAGLTALAGSLTVALALTGPAVGWFGLARVARAGGRYGRTEALAIAEGDEEAGAVEDGAGDGELDCWAAGLMVLAPPVHPATVPMRIARAGRAARRMSRVRDMSALNAYPFCCARFPGTKMVDVLRCRNRPILHFSNVSNGLGAGMA